MSSSVAIEKIGIIGGGIGGLFLTSYIVQNWPDYPDIYMFDPRFDERGEARTSRTSGFVYQGWAGSYGIPLVDPSIVVHKIDTITFHKSSNSVETSEFEVAAQIVNFTLSSIISNGWDEELITQPPIHLFCAFFLIHPCQNLQDYLKESVNL